MISIKTYYELLNNFFKNCAARHLVLLTHSYMSLLNYIMLGQE